MLLAFALLLAADAPPELSDPTAYLHADTYDLTPARRAEWEAGRVSASGLWVGLGSVTYNEFDAVERGNLHLAITPGFVVHAEIRNDRDRDGSVTRVVADLLLRVREGFYLGISGSPGVRKQDYALGASVLFTAADRRCYLLARLVADAFLYNRTNTDGGTRAAQVLHPQIEARLARGRFSLYGSLDAVTPSEIVYPQDPLSNYRSSSRTELSFHARWEGEVETDARFDLAVLRDSANRLEGPHQSSRTIATWRLEALFPEIASGLRPRLGLRLLRSAGRGIEGGTPWSLARLEPGARVAAQWTRGAHLVEAGYDVAVPDIGLRPARERSFQDKVYGYWEYSFDARFHLRFLLSYEPASRRFGGGDGALLAQF
jgi:hypothetical protein